MTREEIKSKIRGLEMEITRYYDLIDENIDEEEDFEDYYDRIDELTAEIDKLTAEL